MPDTTPRMAHPIPSREMDPWYDAFVDFANALDSSEYAYREDRNAIFSGGGTLAWNATTGVLSWDANISILAAVTGYLWQIPAGSDVIDSAEGIIFYVTLDRGPGSNSNVAIATANKLGSISPDNVMVIAVRIGTTLYFRTGLVLEDGATATGIMPGGGGGVGGFEADFGSRKEYTQAGVPVEENAGSGMVDGSRATSGTPFFWAVFDPTFGVPGIAEIRLYDLGTPSTPAAPLLIRVLQATTSGQVYMEFELSTAASRAADTIAEEKRVYQVRVFQNSQIGDTVVLGSAGIAVR